MTNIIDFSRYSSIRIGPRVEVNIISEIVKLPQNSFIVGGANNLLISDHPPKLFMLDKRYNYIYEDEKGLHIGGATPSIKILSYAKRNNIGGFEVLQRLPGYLGGMLRMNAGIRDYCVTQNLIHVLTHEGEIPKEECGFGYRTSSFEGIAFEGLFEIKKGFDKDLVKAIKDSRGNQPKAPSAGSCFKNPKGDFAGRILEECGFKGRAKNSMSFSQTHANFLVNNGGGTFEDALFLINEAKKEVFDKLGINLELEIKVLA